MYNNPVDYTARSQHQESLQPLCYRKYFQSCMNTPYEKRQDTKGHGIWCLRTTCIQFRMRNEKILLDLFLLLGDLAVRIGRGYPKKSPFGFVLLLMWRSVMFCTMQILIKSKQLITHFNYKCRWQTFHALGDKTPWAVIEPVLIHTRL